MLEQEVFEGLGPYDTISGKDHDKHQEIKIACKVIQGVFLHDTAGQNNGQHSRCKGNE